MNVMTVDGYHAKIEYDEELDLFRGEILGLSGGADFYGKNPEELRVEFKASLKVFLQVCAEKASNPESISQANSTTEFHRRCTNNSPLLHKPKAKASTCWPKKLCVSMSHLPGQSEGQGDFGLADGRALDAKGEKAPPARPVLPLPTKADQNSIAPLAFSVRENCHFPL